METKRSERFRLNIRDLVKGTITAACTAGVTAAYTGVESGRVDLSTTVTTAIMAAFGYIIKNIFENKDGEIVGTKSDETK